MLSATSEAAPDSRVVARALFSPIARDVAPARRPALQPCAVQQLPSPKK